jgi:hypothetical protein
MSDKAIPDELVEKTIALIVKSFEGTAGPAVLAARVQRMIDQEPDVFRRQVALCYAIKRIENGGEARGVKLPGRYLTRVILAAVDRLDEEGRRLLGLGDGGGGGEVS